MESNMHACFEIAGFYPHTFFAIPIYHSEHFVIVFDKKQTYSWQFYDFLFCIVAKRLKMENIFDFDPNGNS